MLSREPEEPLCPRRPPAPSLGARTDPLFVEAGRREPTPQATLGIVRGALPAAAAEASAARSTHPYRRRRRADYAGAQLGTPLFGAGSVAWQARQSPGDVCIRWAQPCLSWPPAAPDWLHGQMSLDELRERS